MWNTIANFKENLSQMASEVLDTVEELESATPQEGDEDLPTVSNSKAGRGFHTRRRSGDAFHSYSRSRRIHESEEGNGVANHEDYESKLRETQRKCQDLESRQQELLRQIETKEQAYRALDDSYRNAVDETEKLKGSLEKIQLDLAAANAQLKEREAKELTDQIHQVDRDNDKVREEIQRRDERISQLQDSLSKLEREHMEIQAEKERLQTALNSRELELQEASSSTAAKSTLPEPSDDVEMEVLKTRAQQVDVLLEKLATTQQDFEKEINNLKTKLEAVTLEKDKAVSDLSRLKQHLLEKENEDSEKMDQDSEQIAILEAKAAAASTRVIQLEEALSQALATQSETNKRLNEDLQASGLEIQSLKSKISDFYKALEAKDIEIANLQMALGQYYAESDAKERLQREMQIAREDLKRLSAELEAAKRTIDIQELQKREALEKLQLEQQKVRDSQDKTQKIQEDMLRLRRALEESMIRLNRMSSDSDYSVDRRIVIKLLVTYFEKAHSREVLDLMARMLGFSDDDKRRVGLAHQNAGKPGVVRSVLGLPGRVVGGLLGGSSEVSPLTPSSNQSFADLWIDFLLKESEERDRKEKAEAELAASQNSGEHASGSESHPDALNSKSQNGFARDDIFGADFSTHSPSLIDDNGVKSHRRVYSRP